MALPACCNSKSTPPGWLVAKSVRLATKPSTAIHRSPWKAQKHTETEHVLTCQPGDWVPTMLSVSCPLTMETDGSHYINPYGQRNFNIHLF